MIVTTVMLLSGACARAGLDASITSETVATQNAIKSFDIAGFLKSWPKASLGN
jgi:hypothetical protein